MAYKPRKFIVPTKLNSHSEVLKILRNQFTQWHERRICLDLSKIARGKYKCAICGVLKGPKQRQCDHIKAIGKTPRIPKDPTKITPKLCQEIGEWFFKVFCPLSNLRTLCLDCHKKKTAQDATERSFKK